MGLRREIVAAFDQGQQFSHPIEISTPDLNESVCIEQERCSRSKKLAFLLVDAVGIHPKQNPVRRRSKKPELANTTSQDWRMTSV